MKKLSDRFYQIKKKHVIWAIVKSAVCGISLGLAVVGVLLLALKLSAITLAAVYYALIGIGVALVGGCALYFVFRPTDKTVAKRTDDDFGLNERVQTALAYSDESGTLVELQREDAEEKIKSLPKDKFSFAKIWKFIVIFAVSLAIAAAGIFVPAREPSTPPFTDPDSTPREITPLERAGVRELIADIEASSLEDELKTSVGEALGKLLTDLDSVDTEGKLKTAVDAAISSTSATLTPTLTYSSIGSALTDADLPYLGQAVSKGGVVYKYYMLTAYDEVRIFDAIKYDASNIKVVKGVSPFRSDLALSISAGLSQLLGDISSDITEALAASKVSKDDGLYILMNTLAVDLATVKSHIASGRNDTDIQTEIGDLVTNLIINLTNTLSTQAYNAAINIFVPNRLKTIFQYYGLELPIEDPDKSDGDKDSDTPGEKDPTDPDRQPSGGGGSGEMEYGSDDMVWVPGRGYMRYGDIIDEYYSLINQYLHSDELTEEQKSMIKAYYDILFGSNKNN